MMELYQAFADYTEMMTITERLIDAGRARRAPARRVVHDPAASTVDLAAAVATARG